MAIEVIGSSLISIIELLLVASVVSLVVRRVKLPYSIALVITGLALSFLEVIKGFSLTPELLFTIFLPALLFEAAISLNTEKLIKHKRSVSVFAFAGTLISILVIGLALHLLLKLPLQIAFLFGAIIAPTDPISVISVFKEMGVTKRLTTIIEGEALFNDGVSIVLFKVLLGLLLAQQITLANASLLFLKNVIGGVGVGFLAGYIFVKVIKRVDEPFVELTLTTALAYGSYIIAEYVTVSGIIAVVFAGLYINFFSSKVMSASTRLAVSSNWEYVSFVINSLIFLMIGLEIKIGTLMLYWQPIAIAFVVVLLSRVIAVYPLSAILSRTGRKIDMSWNHVLVWGGLRGSVSMVLALSLPASLTQRSLLLSMCFGVVLFSLIIQGITIKPVISLLGLKGKERDKRYQILLGQLLVNISAKAEVEKLYRQGAISKKVYEDVIKGYDELNKKTEKKIEILIKENPELELEQINIIKSVAFDAGKDAIREAHRNELISEDVMKELLTELDQRIAELKFSPSSE